MDPNRDLWLSKIQISTQAVSLPGWIEQSSALDNSVCDKTNLTWHNKKKITSVENLRISIFAYVSFQVEEYLVGKWSLDSISGQKSVWENEQ